VTLPVKRTLRGTAGGKALRQKACRVTSTYPHWQNQPSVCWLAELGDQRMGRRQRVFSSHERSWQMSNIHGGTGASSIIPGQLVVDLYSALPENQRRRKLTATTDRRAGRSPASTVGWVVGSLPFYARNWWLLLAGTTCLRQV
jgi:succinyl-diaminopimelate desuccinylase